MQSRQRIAAPQPIPFESARRFAKLSKPEKYTFAAKHFNDIKALTIRYTWPAWARDKQLWQVEAPWDWETWVILAGRGFGKTRTGAEWVIECAAADAEAHIALVGRTAADVRDVMVGGKSGIIANSPPWFKPTYNPSRRSLKWPNGARATTYSADQPDQLRGPQHSKAWADERAAWQYDDSWDQLQFGLRIGEKPQGLVTTTPRATKGVKELVADPRNHITYGTTYENQDNLAGKFLRNVERKYGGTRLGRQELEGRILDDNPGALWNRERMIEAYRVRGHPPLIRIVVAVDPSVKGPSEVKARNHEFDEGVAETGIIVVGLGEDGHAYVLADYSLQGKPREWAEAIVTAYNLFEADLVVGEDNNGGDLVEVNVRTVSPNISYRSVHASRGKYIRAEPVSSLYEQGRVHHVGTMPDLEDQLCLAGDTLIACEHGNKRIDEIRQGERVWTRQGLKKVAWADCTQKEASVVRLSTSNNRHLVATMGHPVYNSNRGEFVPVGLLRQGDTLEVFSCTEDGAGAQRALMAQPGEWENMAHKWSGMGDYGASMGLMATIDMQKVDYSIGQFGKMLMGQFQRIAKSITKMGISRIIDWITCNWSHVQSIRRYNIVAGLPGAQNNVRKAFAPMFGENGNHKTMYANTVERPSKAQTCAPAGVPGDVVASLEAIEQKIPVYNLEVEGCHEYYANGILVHNCNWEPGMRSPDRLDALVWALTELMLDEEEEGGIVLYTPPAQPQQIYVPNQTVITPWGY